MHDRGLKTTLLITTLAILPPLVDCNLSNAISIRAREGKGRRAPVRRFSLVRSTSRDSQRQTRTTRMTTTGMTGRGRCMIGD